MSPFAPDYRYLKAFIVISRTLNFSAAAKELGIAQSAVSRQIKLLEESIGHQLLVRSSKKVVLTKIGEEFSKQVSQFEEKIKDTLYPNVSKTIHIGILHGFLETWFNDVIVEFSKRYKYQLIIEVNSLENLRINLHNGKYDLIFTSQGIQSEFVSSLKLFEEKMVLIGKKSQLEFNQLHEYPWIVYSNQDHLFQLNKKKSDHIIIINSITAMIKLARKGLGIAIVPEHTIEDRKNLQIVDVKGLPKQHIYLSTLNFKKVPEYVKSLIEIIQKIQK
jgi:DNA-binding transcriptional LysR family regulator